MDTSTQSGSETRGRKWRPGCLGGLILLALLLILPHLFSRPQQKLSGIGCASGLIPVSTNGIKLLIDSTAYNTRTKKRVIQQEIFDHMLSAIGQAQHVIYLDFFLWNGWQGKFPEEHRKLSSELADALVRRKKAVPDLDVLVLTDPLNRIYGNHEPEFFHTMRDAGIHIVFTDVDRLPDSNLIYSPYARFFGPAVMRLPGVKNWFTRARWPNLLQRDGAPVSTLQLAKLLFFKANHRKVLVTDHGGNAENLRLIVSSFNPTDASSAHGNVGVQVDGAPAAEALRCELEVYSWSAENPDCVLTANRDGLRAAVSRMKKFAGEVYARQSHVDTDVYAEWLTEDAIRDRIIGMLETSGNGDRVCIGMFYLSDRGVVQSIKAAIRNGAAVRVLLDPNKDAFGRTKNGVPNRPVANELLEYAAQLPQADFALRWADTHGEQYHTKAMAVSNPETGRYGFICGSANWTRRNIGRYNLEADIYVKNDRTLNEAFEAYFDRVWRNDEPLRWSADYCAYAESGFEAWWKNILYRFQEASGAGTF